MSFKLIAIRPLMDYKSSFIKNLRKDQVYCFYNNYKFKYQDNNSSNEIIRIEKEERVPSNLYDLSYLNDDGVTENQISVNISAIVGKNGSGKSSIADLFLVAVFYMCHKLRFVENIDFIDADNVKENSLYANDITEIEKTVNIECFYSFNSDIYLLKIHKGVIYIEKGIESDCVYEFKKEYKIIQEKSDLPTFFYSMIVNYSIYSFNTNHIGIWLKGVFHKNDGYQMPIVINPYKNQGNSDINTETYLTRGRVLSNLITIEEYRKKINPKSEVEKVELFFDTNKDYSDKFSEEEIRQYRETLIKPLFAKVFKDAIAYPDIDTNIKKYAESYLIQKIKNIPIKYKIFEDFKDIKDHSLNGKYIDAIFQNRTHITLKIFQVINFINDHSYYRIPTRDFSTILDLDKITIAIEEKKKIFWFTEPIEYLPPAFLFTRIIFKDGSKFDDLSSGERQKIYSLNSIIYHLSNLDSVSKHHNIRILEKPIVYENVNLILDEIELYYHPEFQRNFITDLLDFIKNAKFQSIKSINVLFLTHSPFILSDIPSTNILFLDVEETEIEIDGVTVKRMLATPQQHIKNTFAANIHELFRSGFFMKTTQGAFALSKITEIIEFCDKVDKAFDETELSRLKEKYNVVKENFKSIVDLIGEDYIVNVLKNNILQVEKKLCSKEDFLKNRYNELEDELNKIKNQLND